VNLISGYWKKLLRGKINKMGKFWPSQSVLVVGGNGYLGVEMIQGLLQEKATITSVDRGEAINPIFRETQNDFEYVSQDLSDFDGLKKLLQKNKFSVCFCLVGFSSIAKARESPLDAFLANVQAVLNLLEAFRGSNNFPNTVVASSNHVYGKQVEYPTPENAPLNSKDIYGVTKSCGDMITRAFASTYDVPISIARITNTYGGHEPFRNHLIPYIISEIQKGEAPVINGNGESMKGFLYIKDTIKGLMALARGMDKKQLWGEAFNFFPDENISVLNIVKTILRVMDRQDLPIKTNAEFEKSGNADIEFLSNHSAKLRLDWRQEVPLEMGVKLSIEDYKKYEVKK